jgi:5-methyltetrahydrofolate--homocysteine methyltransferase
MSALLDDPRKATLDAENRKDQDRLRKLHEEKQRTPLLPYRKALENRLLVEWRQEDAPAPPFLGTRTVEPNLAALRDYIDWTFFFTAWELKGSYPQILDDPRQGEAARELFDVGQEVLERIVSGGLLEARGVYGYFPAHAEGDDIVLEGGWVFHCLRQQADRGQGEPNKSIADLVAPLETGVRDHVGAFAVSAGFGADDLAKAYEAEHDDYRAIVAKALADRLAEAFAEYLHEQVRREWYAPDEHLTNQQLIKERYRGTRPAFGYPACPDHSEKRTLFELLNVTEATGIDLTTSFAMMPPASVSGLYLAHPQARYFHVGRIAKDQVEDYARRKGESLTEAERWLAPNLAYEPG